MEEIVIHGVPGSPFMRAVQITCEEKNAPYRIAALDPGAPRTAERLALHAFGRMPTIDHGDYRLYETQAIIRYIDAAFGVPSLTPTDPRAIGCMNQIIGINDWYFFQQVVRTLVFQRVVGPVVLGIPTDEAICAASIADAELCIGELTRLLGDKTYFAGDALSHADILLAPHMYYFAMTPEGDALLKRNAPLARWLERMNARKSMQATLPPDPLRKAA